MSVVRMVKRILAGLVALVAFVVYVWFAAVRARPVVKRRKAALRARRYGPAVDGERPPGTST
jgi:hypothetical protein